MTCASMTTLSVPLPAPVPRVVSKKVGSRNAKPSRHKSICASASTSTDSPVLDAIRTRAATGSLPGASPFPLLSNPKTYSHVSPGVCDTCANDVEQRKAWVVLLLGQLPSHRANAERTLAHVGAEALGSDFNDRYLQWEKEYEAYLEKISDDATLVKTDQGATLLDMVDEKERLLRKNGLDDLFAGMKAQENEVASALFPILADEIDSIWQPAVGSLQLSSGCGDASDEKNKKINAIQTVLECCLAGNLFDAGAAAAVQGMSKSDDSDECASSLDASQLAETFAEARRRVRRDGDRGWRFDSFDAVSTRITSNPWKRVVIFCDNAGADVMGMTLLARTLAGLGGKGTKVVLASNKWAALNDVTDTETKQFLKAVTEGEEDCGTSGSIFNVGDALLGAQVNGGQVNAVSSGQMSTLLDLNRTGGALNEWVAEETKQVPAGEDWLLVFDGMGRSLESNWNVDAYVKTGVNTFNLAMVKSEINAKRLKAEVYDCVVKLGEGK